jgi:hypothetical protein
MIIKSKKINLAENAEFYVFAHDSDSINLNWYNCNPYMTTTISLNATEARELAAALLSTADAVDLHDGGVFAEKIGETSNA